LLLPSFNPIARVLEPVSRWLTRSSGKRGAPPTPGNGTGDDEEPSPDVAANASVQEQEGLIEGEERRLLQSIVDFGGTLVREVMTPRPDIVAIREDATFG
jgi:CBS domain containing-hemolysin-like protein